MKARFAKAIRAGIEAAKRTNYGQVGDTYYPEREAILDYAWLEDHKANELAKLAFERTWERNVKKAAASMTLEERAAASKNHDMSYTLYTETRSEKYQRLILERVERLEETISRMEKKCATDVITEWRLHLGGVQ